MVLTLLLFFIATFGMVAAGVIGYGFLVERRALTGEDRTANGHDIGWVEPFDLLKSESFSTISFWDRVLSRVDYVEIMKVRIREAGLNWSVGRLTLLMLLLGTVAAVLIGNLRWASWMIAAAGGLSVAILPYLYVLRRRRKRMEKFESQFPDSLDSLARALRAGHPLAAGLQILAMESAEPLAGGIHAIECHRTDRDLDGRETGERGGRRGFGLHRAVQRQAHGEPAEPAPRQGKPAQYHRRCPARRAGEVRGASSNSSAS